jgi:hypothetical protein
VGRLRAAEHGDVDRHAVTRSSSLATSSRSLCATRSTPSPEPGTLAVSVQVYAERLESSRPAVYKAARRQMEDARRALRRARLDYRDHLEVLSPDRRVLKAG